MKTNFLDAWGLGIFTHKKEQKGEKVTYGTYVDRFGNDEIKRYFGEKGEPVNNPFITKYGENYQVSKEFLTMLKIVRNIL